MKVLVIGSAGNMGRRYCAILKYLNIDHAGYDAMDFGTSPNYKDFTHFIIATPTRTHLSIISSLAKYNVPILCEKPICTSSRDLAWLLEEHPELDLTMMMQYWVLLMEPYDDDRESYYNFFKTGNDGLYWDCMQIIALHEGDFSKLQIGNISPEWKCQINGWCIELGRMDGAYISFIQAWLHSSHTIIPVEFKGKNLIDIHEKVERYIEYAKSHDRNSSAVN